MHENTQKEQEEQKMKYTVFKGVVNRAVKGTGTDIRPVFRTDGRNYFAYCDGVRFTSSLRNGAVTMRWGSGHQIMLKVGVA